MTAPVTIDGSTGPDELQTVLTAVAQLPDTALGLDQVVALPVDRAVLAPCELPRHAGLVEDWLADLTRRVELGQRAEQTRDIYGRAIRPWIRFLAEGARTDDPNPTTVEAFLAWARSAGLAPATINHLLATMCSLYRYAERTGRYPHIARAADRLREHRDGPLPCLDHDQVQALRARATDELAAAAEAKRSAPPRQRVAATRTHLVALRNRAILGMLYGTGARLISLHRADVRDWSPERAEWRHRPKGHLAADTVAYLGTQASAELQAYLETRRPLRGPDPLFISHAQGSAGHRLTVRMLSRVVLEILERAGHVARDDSGHVVQPRRLSAHSIRRSAAKRIVETHDLELARQLLGHASLETTRKAYARIKRAEDLRKAAEELG
jgi:site-specific recombinase XerD